MRKEIGLRKEINKALELGHKVNLELDERVADIDLGGGWFSSAALAYSQDMPEAQVDRDFDTYNMKSGKCTVMDTVDGEVVAYNCYYFTVETGDAPRILLKVEGGWKYVAFENWNTYV